MSKDENDNICCDNSQSKINPVNSINLLNDKKESIKKNNYFKNEVKNESENYISTTSNAHKIVNHNHDSNNYKNPDFSHIFNRIINKNEDSSGQKFRLNDDQKKNELVLESKIVDIDSIQKFDARTKNKLTVLNKNIEISVLSYKFCRFFSTCKKKTKTNEDALENSFNYLTKSLDIFTYLRTIKNQDVLINMLVDPDNYELYKKLESIHFNSNNIFDKDDIYITNKGKRRKSSINDLDGFLDSFIQLINKTNKTQVEQRLIELIIKEINVV